jgi:hypothetical protein
MLHPDLEAQVRRELVVAWHTYNSPRATESQRAICRHFLSLWGAL